MTLCRTKGCRVNRGLRVHLVRRAGLCPRTASAEQTTQAVGPGFWSAPHSHLAEVRDLACGLFLPPNCGFLRTVAVPSPSDPHSGPQIATPIPSIPVSSPDGPISSFLCSPSDEAITLGLHLRFLGTPGRLGCVVNPTVSSSTSLWPELPGAPTRSQACGLESTGTSLPLAVDKAPGLCPSADVLARVPLELTG